MLGPTNPNASGGPEYRLHADCSQTRLLGTSGSTSDGVRDSNNGSGVISIELQKTEVPTEPAPVPMVTQPRTATHGAVARPATSSFVWDQQGGSTAISGSALTIPRSRLSGRRCSLNRQWRRQGADTAPTCSGARLAIDFIAGRVSRRTARAQSFANTIPGTVTGNSDTADYKDAVLSAFPPVSNCGVGEDHEGHQPGRRQTGPSGGFGYTLARAGGEDVKFGGPTSITDNLPAHGDSDTFTDIVIGNNFTLAEATQVAPWAARQHVLRAARTGGDVSAGPATGFTVVGRRHDRVHDHQQARDGDHHGDQARDQRQRRQRRSR